MSSKLRWNSPVSENKFMVRAWKKKAKFTLAATTETTKALDNGTHWLLIDSDEDLMLDFSSDGETLTMTTDWPRAVLGGIPTEIMVPVAEYKDSDTIYCHFYSSTESDVKYVEG